MDTIKPSSRYSIRLYVLITIASILLLSVGIVLAWIWSADWAHAIHINQALQAYVIIILLGYLFSLWIAHHYFLSMVYKLNADEVRIQRGVWMESIQHVPLRNIGGITVKRDFLDRCLEIGTLEFMLINSQDHKRGDIRLVGLSDIDAQYHKLADMLLHDWGKTMQHSNSEVVESRNALVNSAIDMQ